PSGSEVRSTSTVPARAAATTSGGDARKFMRTSGWIRPSKFRLPESTAATSSAPSAIASETAGSSEPELPMQVVQPYPTRVKPSVSSGSTRSASWRYRITDWDPGASDVFTQGLLLRPARTAFRARSAAAIMTAGFDVFVQLVIAAITTWPWVSVTSD